MIRYYDYDEKEDRLTVRCFLFCSTGEPSLIIRCDSRGIRLHIYRRESFSLSQVSDEIFKLYSFLDNPHWKSTLRTDFYMRQQLEKDSSILL